MTTALKYGRIGARYGALIGVSLFGPLLLFIEVTTLLNWPSDGTLRWFVEGLFSFGLVFGVIGSTFGACSGFLLGVLGALMNRPLGWIGAGLVAGAIFRELNVGLLSVFRLAPLDLSVTYGLDFVCPLLAYTLFGFLLERAARTDKPRLWWRDQLQDGLSNR